MGHPLLKPYLCLVLLKINSSMLQSWSRVRAPFPSSDLNLEDDLTIPFIASDIIFFENYFCIYLLYIWSHMQLDQSSLLFLFLTMTQNYFRLCPSLKMYDQITNFWFDLICHCMNWVFYIWQAAMRCHEFTSVRYH